MAYSPRSNQYNQHFDAKTSPVGQLIDWEVSREIDGSNGADQEFTPAWSTWVRTPRVKAKSPLLVTILVRRSMKWKRLAISWEGGVEISSDPQTDIHTAHEPWSKDLTCNEMLASEFACCLHAHSFSEQENVPYGSVSASLHWPALLLPRLESAIWCVAHRLWLGLALPWLLLREFNQFSSHIAAIDNSKKGKSDPQWVGAAHELGNHIKNHHSQHGTCLNFQPPICWCIMNEQDHSGRNVSARSNAACPERECLMSSSQDQNDMLCKLKTKS